MMTDPKEQQREQDEPDELELEPETVKDLDADAEDAEDVRGGGIGGCISCSKTTA
jgi:hypothetical protein